MSTPIMSAIEPSPIELFVSNNTFEPVVLDNPNTRVLPIPSILYVGSTSMKNIGELLCPIIPYISETIDLLKELSTCADTVWVYGLSGTEADPDDIGWQNTKRILTANFKEISQEVESAIISKDHPYWQDLRKEVINYLDGKELDVRLHI